MIWSIYSRIYIQCQKKSAHKVSILSFLKKSKVFCHMSWACVLLHAGFLFGLFFDFENGANLFLRTTVEFQRTTWHYIPEYITTEIHTGYRFVFSIKFHTFVAFGDRYFRIIFSTSQPRSEFLCPISTQLDGKSVRLFRLTACCTIYIFYL
jgi:hypothetical protein